MSVITRARKAKFAGSIVIAAVVAFGAANIATAHAARLAGPRLGKARVAAAGGLAAGRVLGGLTSQHWPVIVTLCPY